MKSATYTQRGYVDWLPDVLTGAGLDVYVMPGAATRSTWDSGFTLEAIIWHHTATGLNWQDGHVAALLRDGRIDLDGPLSQVGVERDGTWVIVAMGRANHNGYGRFGNDSLGLEFFNSGKGEPWPAMQVESGVIGIAAIRNYLGTPVPLLGHKESDPSRKIDPFGLNMDSIRQRVAAAKTRFLTGASLEDDTMHVELIKMAYRRSPSRTKGDPSYDPSVKDAGGWTHWMQKLAAARTPEQRDDVVKLCNYLIDIEIERNKA